MKRPLVLRPAFTHHLQERLKAFDEGFRHNLAVLGPVGSGKSQLVQHALASCDVSLTKIYCNLQGGSVREFLQRFSRAILHSVLKGPADGPLEDLLQEAAQIIPRTTAAIQQLERYTNGHLQAEAFAHALDVIPILHEERRQPCVLVLDEFLALEELGLSHAFHELGKRVMVWPFTLFWLMSSSPFRAQNILRERLQLLFGQFELVSLGTVEAAAGRQWMAQFVRGTQHQPSVSDFLLHWVGTYPWYIQVLVTRMREIRQLQRKRRSAEEVLFQASWDVLGSPNGVLYHWCSNRLERIMHDRYGVLARQALVAIALGARTTQAVAQQTGSRRSLSQALQLLVSHDIVERRGTCWIISDRVLACWLAAVLAPNLQHGSVDRDRARETFEVTVRGIWGKWLEANGQPLAARIHRLMEQFGNETVSLDSKTGRLPAFRSMKMLQPGGREATYLVADAEERRWCCLVHEGRLDESQVSRFEAFCRSQYPRPSRKVVVAREGFELNAKLLAKEANMWVWEGTDMNLLFLLYGHPPL